MPIFETASLIEPVTSCYNLVNCATLQVDYVLNGTVNGVVLSTNVGKVVGKINDGTNDIYGCWTIQASTSCNNLTSGLSLFDLYDSCEDCNYCGCPPTYSYDSTTGNCVKVVPPNAPTAPVVVLAARPDTFYSVTAPVFYEDITAKQFPLIATPQTAADATLNTPIPPSTTPHPNVNILPPSPWPPVLVPPVGGSGTSYSGYALRENVGTGNVINPVLTISPLDPKYAVWYVNGSNNWLVNNGVGISAQAPWNVPIKNWYGFSKCIEITEEKTYCIALAANNAGRLFLDDNLIVEINIGDGIIWPLSYVHVFPITLQPGTYQLRGEGLNYSAFGDFAFAIYEGDVATVAACTTQSDLNDLAIFRSSNQIGGFFQTGSDTTYTPTCDPGFTYTNCDGNQCVSILPFRPCCYNLVNCETQQIEYQFTFEGTSQVGILNPSDYAPPLAISAITVNDGVSPPITISGCFTLQSAECVEAYTTYPWGQVEAIASVTNCTECLGSCYILTDCAEIFPSIIVGSPQLLQNYIGSTIGFEITNSTGTGYAWPNGTYCATVAQSTTCLDAVDLQLVNIVEYTNCNQCSPPCYVLTDCTDPTNTMIVSGDLSQYVGQTVVTLAGCSEICWTVQISDTCQGSIPSPVITSSYPPTGNQITKCCYSYGKATGFNGTLEVNNSVYPLTPGSYNAQALIDQINNILGTLSINGIATIQSFNGSNSTGFVICITGEDINGIIITYQPSVGESPVAEKTCSLVPKACSYNDVDQTFPFTGNIAIIIDGTPYPFIGVTVNDPVEFVAYFNSLNKGDFTVVYTETSPGDYNFTIYVTGPYTYGNISIGAGGPIAKLIQIDECQEGATPDCASCLPDPPPPPTPDPVKPRAVKPGYKTPACSPEYTEKVNCTFGEAYYNIMLANRYGLDNCCDIDTQKWSIKKAWLDLEEKKNPEFQCNNTPVCPSCRNASCCCQNPNDCIN